MQFKNEAQIKNPLRLIGISFALLMCLSGCSPFVQVKDITQDKSRFLAENYSLESLPSAVRDKLPAAGSHPLPFNKLTVLGIAEGKFDTTTKHRDFKEVIINAQNTGVVQTIDEMSANGVPESVTFAMSYLSIYALKQGTATYSAAIAPLPMVVKDADNNEFAFDAPSENKSYVTPIKLGTSFQIVNFETAVWTCHAGRYYAAFDFNAAFAGRAIDLDCDLTKNGIVSYKARRTFLTEYGIALTRTVSTATGKIDWTYTSIEKDAQM
ncbi:hypothetical protein [Caballeronia sp. INDeC2]|uniref:hypothetical protein n=1 Tax=Caballeronia sp. INDeC2 TaxID=2921747 RepID=UPI00202868BC|nr:hypothetical protein [Caballeronia sp. INDeC2]